MRPRVLGQTLHEIWVFRRQERELPQSIRKLHRTDDTLVERKRVPRATETDSPRRLEPRHEERGSERLMSAVNVLERRRENVLASRLPSETSGGLVDLDGPVDKTRALSEAAEPLSTQKPELTIGMKSAHTLEQRNRQKQISDKSRLDR
jgi:hypothetical protein